MRARPVIIIALTASACGTSADQASRTTIGTVEAAAEIDASGAVDTIDHVLEFRDPDVPDLPFDDNPDPDQCGIPVRWGTDEAAWLTGIWQGELVQPEVLLYDSHVRLSISGRAAHGSEVRIVLYQSNPVLDYYLVRTIDGSTEGWIPAPFLSFEPIDP